MQTRVISIDENAIDLVALRQAANALKEGKLVAFPTETVYGLGANALDAVAVAKIFEAKGRPQDNPLIVHIVEEKDLAALVRQVPLQAQKLINAFWPGPLTLVLKKSSAVPDNVTAGLDSVAVRMPADPVASALIREAGVPVAAPSANISGRPSPTAAEHVIHDLHGRVDFIVAGGRTRIGVESTVIDMTVRPPVLLRPGGVTLDDLKRVIGKVDVASSKAHQVKSPGMKYKHYAPMAKVVLAGDDAELRRLIDEYKKKSCKVGVLATVDAKYAADVTYHVGVGFDEFARNLFDTFRKFDEQGVDVILVQGVEEEGLGLAIMNRLKKACEYVVDNNQ